MNGKRAVIPLLSKRICIIPPISICVRKVVELTRDLCEREGVTDWRQSTYQLKQVKKCYRRAQKAQYSNSKDSAKQEVKREEVDQCYRDYLSEVNTLIEKIDHYLKHAERQMDQIDRRVLKGETIPPEEKVFSIFETHTEWASTKSRRHEAREKPVFLSNSVFA